MDVLFELVMNNPAFDELNSAELWLVCEMIRKIEYVPKSESELMELVVKIDSQSSMDSRKVHYR